jgi:uncharacterized protein (TIGR03118 family)
MISIASRGCGRAIIRLGVWWCCCWATCGFVAVAARGDPVVTVTNLVTDDQTINAAQITDPFLKNAWGLAHSTGSPFWVSDNASGVATLYQVNPATNVTAKMNLGSPPGPSGGVVIPPLGSGTPTGQVFNSASASGALNGDVFLFVNEDGTISGWRTALGTNAEVLQTADPLNVYKGAALDTVGGHAYLLSANFRSGAIDVKKGDAGAPALAGNFTDPVLPSGYAPFNVQTLGSRIYVTYALQDGAKHDDVPGAGHGFVSAFDLQGNFLGRIGGAGKLNSPWGLAIAPSSFGSFAGDLLVGNFGDGSVNVYSADPAAAGFVGTLAGVGGTPIAIDGLWGLAPGNDGNGGSSQDVYFSAGPGDEAHGVFGVLSVPEPGVGVVMIVGAGMMRMGARRRRILNAEC